MKKTALCRLLCLTLCLALCLCAFPAPAHAALNGWVREQGRWYYYEDGVLHTDGRWWVGGAWYWFDEAGVMQTGWILDDGVWYYAEGSGRLATGWRYLANRWYYFDPGNCDMLASGAYTVNGTRYYFTASGALAGEGWQRCVSTWSFDGETVTATDWYYTNADGVVRTGWLKTGGRWYYLDETGRMLADDSYEIDGAWYFFTASGALGSPGWNKRVSRWTNRDGSEGSYTEWYYLDASGAARTGWQDIDGVRYHFNDWGLMAADGAYEIDGRWYFFRPSGALGGPGWNRETVRWEADAGGSGSLTLWYYLNADGSCRTGWLEDGGRRYYLEPDQGQMAADGVYEIDGVRYFFASNGQLGAAGWRRDSFGTWYCLNADGSLRTGWVKTGGKWYYLDPAWGNMLSGETRTIDGVSYRFDETGAWISA